MPSWRDMATQMDQVVVHTFDEGGITLQAMVNGAPSGAPLAVPADFDPAFVDQSIDGDGLTVGMLRIVADIHFADLPAGTSVLPGWRLIVAAPSPNAGTYVVDSIEPNNDKTGAKLRLKRP